MEERLRAEFSLQRTAAQKAHAPVLSSATQPLSSKLIQPMLTHVPLRGRNILCFFFFFFITVKPSRVIHKSMGLKYEPSSEPIHISEK